MLNIGILINKNVIFAIFFSNIINFNIMYDREKITKKTIIIIIYTTNKNKN